MRNHPLRRPRSTLLALALSCLGFLVPATSQASDVQFDAVITVAGEETIGFEDRTFSQDFPRFEVQGGALGGKPRRTETHTLCVPAELAMTCALDTSRTHSTDTGWEGGYGQGKPGFGVFVTSMNSPGGAQSASYTLTDPVRMLVGELCLTATVTVRAERLQRGWYEGRQEIYLRCPVRRAWSRTQVIEGIKLSSVDGYTQVGAYTGPLGSPAGIPGSATVYPDDRGYKVQIRNRVPNIAVTAGMFQSSPAQGQNGPLLFARAQANDIAAFALEVTQGVQNLANDMPLIAGRRTMARLYVSATQPEGNIAGELRAFRKGVELAGSPLAAEQTIAVRPDGLNRHDLTHAFLFKLPSAWLGFGDLELRGTANRSGMAQEAQQANNTWTETVRFHIVQQPVDTFVDVPFQLHPHGDRSQPWFVYESSDPTFLPILKHVLRFHPILEAVEVMSTQPIKTPPLRKWNLDKDSVWSELLLAVQMVRLWTGSFSFPGIALDNYWTGLVHPNVVVSGEDQREGLNLGPTSVVHMSGTGAGRPAAGGEPRTLVGGETFAHEVGHSKWLSHTCEEGDPSGQDKRYPYPKTCEMSRGEAGLFAQGHEGYLMTDVYHDLFGLPEPIVLGSVGQSTPSDNVAFPMMSYAHNTWIDPFSYCILLKRQGVPCDPKNISQHERSGGGERLAVVEGKRNRAAQPRPGKSAPALAPVVAADQGPSVTISPVDSGLPSSYVPPTIGAAASGYLVVSGVADVANRSVDSFSLMALQKVPNDAALVTARAFRDALAATPSAPTGQARFRNVLVLHQYTDRSLQSLLRADIVAQLDPQNTGRVAPFQPFMHMVEKAPGAGHFELRHGTVVVQSVSPSSHAPTVRLEELTVHELSDRTKLSWQASDADGDALVYTLLYSADDGKTWQLVASGLTATSYSLADGVPPGRDPLSYFAGTGFGLFRVLAHDGFHTAQDDLDEPFSVPDAAPTVRIHQPDGYKVKLGSTVTLTGSASDREDGPLPSVAALRAAAESGAVAGGSAFSWSSNLDGFLGHGREIQTRKLSRGLHAITLTVKDSDGRSGMATIGVAVGEQITFKNIAGLAVASASTTYCDTPGLHCYAAERANDGSNRTAVGGFDSWASSGAEMPQWLSLVWPGAVKIRRVELYTSERFAIRDYDLQYWKNGAWVTLASVTDNTELHRVHAFPEVQTDRIRVLGKKGPENQPQHVRINELVVYGGPPVTAP